MKYPLSGDIFIITGEKEFIDYLHKNFGGIMYEAAGTHIIEIKYDPYNKKLSMEELKFWRDNSENSGSKTMKLQVLDLPIIDFYRLKQEIKKIIGAGEVRIVRDKNSYIQLKKEAFYILKDE